MSGVVVVKHPAFPDSVQRNVPPEDLDRWLAAGWLRLLNDEQTERFAELEAEATEPADEPEPERPKRHRRR